MTLRKTLLIIAAIFNLICSICSIIAFFSIFPKLAMTYFFISLPLTAYVMLSKPNKALDTEWSIPTNFAEQMLSKSPF